MSSKRFTINTNFDHNYWSKLTRPEQFYYLGFIIADGNVCENRFTIGIAIKDHEWLLKFQSTLGLCDTKIALRDQRPNRNSMSISIQKGCKQWATDLKKYGVVPRKSGKERLPYEYCTNVKEIAALTLGYIDGDCSFFRESSGKYRFATYGSEEVCHQLNEVLEKYVGFSPNPLHQSNKICSTNFTCKYSAKKDMQNLYKFLYLQNPELQNNWLSRKHDLWASFMLSTLLPKGPVAS